jgi:hypothetical protein
MIAGKFSAFMNAQSQLEPVPQTPIKSSFRKANKAVETEPLLARIVNEANFC